MLTFSRLCRLGQRLSKSKDVYRITSLYIQKTGIRNLTLGGLGRSDPIWKQSFFQKPSSSAPLLRMLATLPTPGTELQMPSLSPTMTSGGITAWLKKEGDLISPGDSIAEIMTDKATVEWELADGGYLAKILYPEGSENIDVGTCVAILVDEEKDVAAYKDYKHEASPSGAKSAKVTEPAAEKSAPKAETTKLANLPEHMVIKFPALSPTMEKGSIGSWVKKEGDFVSEGDTLCTIVTDKSTNDFECYDEGYVAKIFVPDGTEDLNVGSLIAVLVKDKESIEAFKDFTPESLQQPATPPSPPPSSLPSEVPKPEVEPEPAPPAPSPKKIAIQSGPRIVASPYAKKLAAEANVSLEGVTGSGPDGRIVAVDVQNLISSGMAKSKRAVVSGEPYMDIPLSQIRRVIAARLTESKQTIPHYYLTAECFVDELVEWRKKLNAKLEADGEGIKLSLNDFIIKAAAMALKNVPEVNSSWQGDFIRQYNSVDISIAVQTDTGLMVPIVRNADSLGLQAISSEVKSLAEKARKGKLKPEEFTGGTFTISNLGMFGIQQFCAIVNPPQVAILAVGTAQPRLFKNEKTNAIDQRSVLQCTLSCDHRVVDGAVGAMWLKDFRNYLEQPLTMLL